MAAVTLREVTASTVRAICTLETTEEQRRFVAPNAVSIAQAYFEPRATLRAVYADELPIGFVMWRPVDDSGGVFLWRFMIDRHHQRKGYARQVIVPLIGLLRDAGHRRLKRASCLVAAVPLGSIVRSTSSRRTSRCQTVSRF